MRSFAFGRVALARPKCSSQNNNNKESQADRFERYIRVYEHKQLLLSDDHDDWLSPEHTYTLANLYLQRIRGARAHNLEKGIELFRKVLPLLLILNIHKKCARIRMRPQQVVSAFTRQSYPVQ